MYGVDTSENLGQKTVSGHDHENSDLSIDSDQQSRNHADNRSGSNQCSSPANADAGQSSWQGIANIYLFIRNETN